MNFVLGFLFHFGLFLYVKGEFFKFGDRKNGTCILLKMDAKFNLTYNEENITQNSDVFDLNGARVVESSSECGGKTFNSILLVRLFPSTENLKFVFEKQKNGQISMRVDLYVEPAKHFHNMNDTAPFEMKDSADLFVGYISRNNSFACRTTQSLFFGNDAPFAMAMNITDLHVQAYNVTGDEFGPAVECEQDLTTTPAALTTTATEPWNETTTEPLPHTTTGEPENTTTAIPETSSEPTRQPTSDSTTVPHTETTITTMPSTTVPHTETTITTIPSTTEPKPPVAKYIVNDGNKVCIVLQGNIKLTFQYRKKDKTMSTANVGVPYNAVVNGKCRFNDSDLAQEISLTFFKTGWRLDIVITKQKQSDIKEVILNKATADGSNYSWQKVKLFYVIDDHFVDAKDIGTNMTDETDIAFGKYTADVLGSYKCKAEQDLDVMKDGSVKLVLSSMQYRAFGSSNSSNFLNKDVSECAADNHTDKGTDHNTLGIVLGCVFGGLAVIIIMAGVVCHFRKRKKNVYDQI